ERPHPEQGGERISEDSLYRLGRSCMWIVDLAEVLQIPDPFITQERHNFPAIRPEALGLLLARFRAGHDLYDMVAQYNQSIAAISQITNELVIWLDNRWKHLLDCDSDGILHPDTLLDYAIAVEDYGSPLSNCVGFLDCTIRKMCRPSEGQEAAYNGYKKMHALKYQAL
ncbi:hypothetical protein BDP27DRAFT_1167527, partial [Rhodocollybia butyracea]